MTRLSKGLHYSVLMLLFAVPPTWGKSASEHFPDDGLGGINVDSPGPGGVMNVTLGSRFQQVSASIPLVAGTPGSVVADDAATALCNAIGSGCPSCGAGTFPGAVHCTLTNPNNEYNITQIGNTLTVSDGTNFPFLSVLSCRTTAGNTHGDAHDNASMTYVLVRIDPNGHQGNVTVKAFHTSTGANPRTCTIDTTGQSDQQIHTEMCDCFASMGLVLNPVVLDNPSLSDVPANFPGYSVRLVPGSNITQFELDGQPGQILTMETNDTVIVGVGVPALSEWGMIILIAFLVLSGIWMIRRRQKLQST